MAKEEVWVFIELSNELAFGWEYLGLDESGEGLGGVVSRGSS